MGHDLLLELARCPIVRYCHALEGASHECAEIVRSQRSLSLADHQVPEPWSGHLETAPILFLSSNPSISLAEEYPVDDWQDDQIIDFFVNRFGGGRKQWILNGRALGKNGLYGGKRPTHFWSAVKRRAEELLGRSAMPGHDYALSEVVHCKSIGELGVSSALAPCVERYLERLISLAGASVVVCLGDKAGEAVRQRFVIPRSNLVYGPITIGPRKRLLAFLAHPSSYGKPKTFRTTLHEEDFARLRAALDVGR